jgi:hypothetical protein
MSGYVKFKVSPLANTAKPAEVAPELGQIHSKVSHFSHVSQDKSDSLTLIHGRRPDGSCFVCGGYNFWQGRCKQVCRICHPPAPGAEVKLE